MDTLAQERRKRKQCYLIGIACILTGIILSLGGTFNLILYFSYEVDGIGYFANIFKTAFQKMFVSILHLKQTDPFMKLWLWVSPKPTLCFIHYRQLCFSWGDIWYLTSVTIILIGSSFIYSGDQTAKFIKQIEAKIKEAKYLKNAEHNGPNTPSPPNQSGEVNISAIIELALHEPENKPKPWYKSLSAQIAIGVLITIIGTLATKLLGLT